MASSSGSTKVCFNSTCKQALEVPRQGWLCRTGDFADLCDRCASTFKEGKFCDTYHLNASGWRCCETCGKQIHCGCIVSFHMFILLDAGGIECINCAKTEYVLTPNPTWPSTSHLLHTPAERIRDISSKNWRSISGSGPLPWRQAPDSRLTSYSLGKTTTGGPFEKLVSDSWRVGPSGSDRTLATGIQSLFHSNPTPLSCSPPTFMTHDQNTEIKNTSGVHVKQLCPNDNGAGPSFGSQAHNAKFQGETRGRNRLFPRYWPRITDQELQQISGSSNSKITPLFEKVLSASDAGKIGRLVLPKKCAETYLPPISEPEGFPLVIQDLKGKDWVLQYRFWPNNNSRMYVLEGVTPCIHSMQLQAGDTVTFNRLEPEGKIVMGFRKASSSNKTNETRKTAHEEDNIAFKSRNRDGTWSEVDKISVGVNKRKKGVNKMCLNGKKRLKLNEEEIIELNITLEQVQGLLRPPLNIAPTVVIIEGVEFQDFQEAPIIGSPKEFSTNHVASLCLTEVEPTPEHDDKSSEKEKGNSIQNPSQLLHADIIRLGNSNQNSSFKSQNIDLNIQPEREEESSPVSDSIGIMRLVQESTQRYIKQQKLSINGKNHD